MRTAVKALIKLRVRTHAHTEILLTAVETITHDAPHDVNVCSLCTTPHSFFMILMRILKLTFSETICNVHMQSYAMLTYR